MTRNAYTNSAAPDVSFTVLCDDDNVNHCPAIGADADGNVVLANSQDPTNAIRMTRHDLRLLLDSPQARALAG
jgi:hypothetical protein